MPLHFPEPHDLERLLTRAAAALGVDLGPAIELAQPIEAETWAYDAPGHQAYPSMTSGRRWQCLAGVDGPEVVVDLVEEADDYTVVSVNHGTLAVELNAAITFCDEQLPDSGDYIVRSLQVPSLHFSSLHLTGPADLLVPLDPPPLAIITVTELPSLLAPLAERLGPGIA